MKDLGELLAMEQNVAAEIHEELKEQFPIGTEVAFMIMHGQVNPSSGKVCGYWTHGYLRVKHHQAKKYSRYAIRDVFYENAVKV